MITQPANLYHQQLAKLIEARIGIAVMTKLQHVFADVLHQHVKDDPSVYLQRLSSTHYSDPDWQTVIQTLTIGETYFMREKTHFDMLRNQILPALIQRRRESGNLYLNIWSAGCATGEEAYSLAILLYELLPDIDQWRIHLLGTDLNAQFLASARLGVYREWAFRQVDDVFKQTYFDRVAGGWRIKHFLMMRVTFRLMNLLDHMPVPAFDLIVCRNVLLYFADLSARKAESLFYDALAPDGMLLLGHAEAIRERDKWAYDVHDDTFIYVKRKMSFQSVASLDAEKTPPRLLLQSVYEQAVNAIQAENYIQAETLIGELLNAEPHNAGGRLLLAVVYANQKKVSAAHLQLDLALDYNPLLADAHYVRAMLHWEAGEMDEAGESLRATLYAQRHHPLASWMMGDYQAKLGKLDRALHHWSNAQRAIKPLLPECPVCVVSPMLAGQLSDILREKLSGISA